MEGGPDPWHPARAGREDPEHTEIATGCRTDAGSTRDQERTMKDDSTRWGREEWTVVQMTALVVIAFVVSMFAIRVPTPQLPLDPQPSPYGYTLSMSLFLLPLARLVYWIFQRPDLVNQRKAAMVGLGAVLPVWCLLDVLLGLSFFKFENAGSTLGFYVPGWSPGQGWVRGLPIEEFVFYVTGIAVILLAYMWASESWLSAYVRSDDERRAHGNRPLLQLHWPPVLWGAGLFGAALLWKKLGPHGYNEGFPGYLLFLLLTTIAPAALFMRVVRPYVNWQAFSLATFGLGIIFLVWEATLAMPYQYWGYRETQMLGVFIKAWGNLPLEAAALWIAAAWLNVTLYELVRLVLANGRPLGDILRPHKEGRGKPSPTPSAAPRVTVTR